MEEFATSICTGQMLKAPTEMDPHLFYELDGGHAMFTKAVAFRTEFSVGDRIPLSCMFEAYRLISTEGERIGYIFTSPFHTVNGGGYLLAYMEAKRGTATVSQTLLKTEEIVIYNYPNKGTLVISPAVGEETAVIFEEQ